MREKFIERKLVQEVKTLGGIALKFISPGFDGMPDRIVLLPRSKIAFVEVKAPRCKSRPLQISRHVLLQRLGFQVCILDSTEHISKILKEIGGNTS